ncbi:hypothetical protein [Aquimarina aggregata]|nr:hypothetical protein [Aquimarina aggregata]
MKKSFYLFSLILMIIGCSEGDIIENNINFTAPLQNCSNGDNFVIFKIDSAINQAISLSFTSTAFELNTVPADITVPLTIQLNTTTNLLISRQFDTAINATYFCASIPPANVNVTQELISNNGTLSINYTIASETDTEIVYDRNFMFSSVTFEGEDIELRQEVFNLGTDQFTIPKP